MNRGADFLRTLFFPRKCPVCRKIIGPDQLVCTPCGEKLRVVRSPACPFCAQSMLLCACEKCPRAFAAAAALLEYDNTSAPILRKLKFSGKRYIAKALAAQMADRLPICFDGRNFDCVTDVPMLPSAQRRRGFNQAQLLAWRLATSTGLPYLPLMEKFRKNETQHSLGVRERRQNIQGVYRVRKGQSSAVIGRDILLIDDIFTTGSTAEECARILRAAGAGSVCVLCAAVAPDPKNRDRMHTVPTAISINNGR